MQGVEHPVVIVLHGPSGVGKDTVIAKLREGTGIHRPTSTTSREPREGEVDGVDYHFVTPGEFLDRIERHEFAERALVYGQLKGLERHEIEGPLAAGQDVIIRTDVQGARRWREVLTGGVFVFLMAESIDVLKRQLTERQTEDDADLARRFAELEAELEDIPNNDYVVQNRHGNVDEAVTEIIGIIERERRNPGRPVPRIDIAWPNPVRPAS
jgi:guanylate kinase